MTTTRPSTSAAPADGDDGVRDLLRLTADAIRDAPEVVVLFVLVAPVAAALNVGGDLLVGAASLVGVLVVAWGSNARTSGSNSTGVRFLLAFVASLVAGIAMLVGLLLLVLPGVYLWLRFYLVIPAVLVDDYGPVEALRTSWRRTGGQVLPVGAVAFGISLSAFLLGAAFLVVPAGGMEPAAERVARGETFLAETAVTMVSGPLIAASSTAIYLRSRE